MALPERFLAADPDAPCEGCEKVRKCCRFCEKCKECCDCPVCPECGLADMLAADWFIKEVGGNPHNSCRCERCPDCQKLFDPDTGGWEEKACVGPMYCGKCLAKRKKGWKKKK